MVLFAELYSEGETIGEGITGCVKKVKHLKTGHEYAMKTINLARVDKAQLGELRNELNILRKLDHPNIVKLYETYEDKKAIKLVMEMLLGGDLSKRHLRREQEVIDVIAQVLSAILHCHNNGVVHRDLKLENVVFSHPPPARTIKLIDFGLSNAVALKKLRKNVMATGGTVPQRSIETDHQQKSINQKVSFASTKSDRDKAERLLLTMCGTAHYMSPEVLKGGYSQSCDLWSVGVMTYMLLTGQAPFDGKSESIIFRKIKRGHVDYSQPLWGKISPHAKPFVQGLLEVDADKRMTAAQALQSKWLEEWSNERARALQVVSCRRSLERTLTSSENDSPQLGTDPVSREASSDDEIETTLEEDVVQSMARFTSYSKLRKAALMVIAHHQSYEQIRDLRNAFLAIDSDHSGTISIEELGEVLRRNGVQDDQVIKRLFDAIDQGRQGEIRYVEFLAATIETRFVCDSEALAQAFDHLDEDHSGCITKSNLKKLLGKGFAKEEVDDMIREADFSGDGCISREDFLKLMDQGQSLRLEDTRDVLRALEMKLHGDDDGRCSAPPKSMKRRKSDVADEDGDLDVIPEYRSASAPPTHSPTSESKHNEQDPTPQELQLA